MEGLTTVPSFFQAKDVEEEVLKLMNGLGESNFVLSLSFSFPYCGKTINYFHCCGKFVSFSERYNNKSQCL